MQNVASAARERVLCADDEEEMYGRDGGAAVAAGSLLLRISLDIAGSSLGDVHCERSTGGGGGGDNDEPNKAV